jgi:hypothetical protein
MFIYERQSVALHNPSSKIYPKIKIQSKCPLLSIFNPCSVSSLLPNVFLFYSSEQEKKARKGNKDSVNDIALKR